MKYIPLILIGALCMGMPSSASAEERRVPLQVIQIYPGLYQVVGSDLHIVTEICPIKVPYAMKIKVIIHWRRQKHALNKMVYVDNYERKEGTANECWVRWVYRAVPTEL